MQDVSFCYCATSKKLGVVSVEVTFERFSFLASRDGETGMRPA